MPETKLMTGDDDLVLSGRSSRSLRGICLCCCLRSRGFRSEKRFGQRQMVAPLDSRRHVCGIEGRSGCRELKSRLFGLGGHGYLWVATSDS